MMMMLELITREREGLGERAICSLAFTVEEARRSCSFWHLPIDYSLQKLGDNNLGAVRFDSCELQVNKYGEYTRYSITGQRCINWQH